MRRTAPGAAAVAVLFLLSGCSTGDQVFPPNGTLTMQVADLTLASQAAETPANQIVSWTVTEAQAAVSGVGTVDFAPRTPCTVEQNFAFATSLTSACGGSGVALEPGTGHTADVRLRITEMTVWRGRRDALSMDGDIDGDGVLDLEDNCPYAPNPPDPEQENVCGLDDAGAASDEDGDGVADASDNCVYVANADQANVGLPVNGIGDACEQEADIPLPSGGLELVWTGQAFTIVDHQRTTLLVDFKTAQSLTCDAAFTCTLDPGLVALTASP